MMHPRLTLVVAFLPALACSPREASMLPSSSHGGAGSAAAVMKSADAGAALPSSAPDRPQYEVPVPSAELQPYATFAVGEVSWAVNGANASLEYTFPSALSGVSGQEVSFHGTLQAPGIVEVSGSAGSARCAFSEQVVRCEEMMPGLATDPANAERMLQSQSISEAARAMRATVIQLFSSDPIGVLTFASSAHSERADDTR